MYILTELLKAKSNLISAIVIQLCMNAHALQSLCRYQNTLQEPWSKTCFCLTNTKYRHVHTNFIVRNQGNFIYRMSGDTLISETKTEAWELPSSCAHPHKTTVKWKQVIKQTLNLKTYDVLSIWTTPTYWVVTASIKLMTLATL